MWIVLQNSHAGTVGGIIFVVTCILSVHVMDDLLCRISEQQRNLTIRIRHIGGSIDKLLNPPVIWNVSKSPVESTLMQIVANMENENTAPKTTRGSNFEPISLIKVAECKHDYKLIILVQSRISHFSERMLIRNTWGHASKLEQSTWGTFFLVAQSNHQRDSQLLYREFEQFKDMIIGDIRENFYTLSLKLQMGFAWAVNSCKFKYLLKSDDDVFVNIRRLFRFLEEKDTPKTKMYAGNVLYRAWVQRSGKYGMTREEYAKEIYPRYCSGGGYILSDDVVTKMYDNFNKVSPMKIDDSYIGELALASGVDAYHHTSFRMYENCVFNENFIVHHPVTDQYCMESLYEKYQNFK